MCELKNSKEWVSNNEQDGKFVEVKLCDDKPKRDSWYEKLVSLLTVRKIWSFSLVDIALIVWYFIVQAWIPILVNKAKGGHKEAPYSAFFQSCIMELLKVLISFFLFIGCYGFSTLKEDFGKLKWKHWCLYFFSGLCYSGVNVLDIYVQNYMDPGSYSLLSRFRLVTTGLLWWIVFKKKLHWLQWLSLFGICVGCCVIAIKTNDLKADTMYVEILGIVLIVVQLAFQAGASVYTEWVLKRDRDMCILVQNVGMYTWGVMINLLMYMAYDYKRCYYENPFSTWNGYTYGHCVLLAVFGITVAKVLKSMSSIVKMVSSSAANLMTIVITWTLLGFKATLFTFIAMPIILLSVVLYAVGTHYNNKRIALEEAIEEEREMCGIAP